MEIVFTVEAKKDLDELRAYLAPLSPGGLRNVADAIEHCITSITTFPNSGRPTPREGVREAIEIRYGFAIPYYIQDGKLFVLRVYRSKRRPLDYAALDLP